MKLLREIKQAIEKSNSPHPKTAVVNGRWQLLGRGFGELSNYGKRDLGEFIKSHPIILPQNIKNEERIKVREVYFFSKS